MRAYLDILARPGALAFCLAGLWTRSGGAMMGIGTVLMVTSLYDSYGLAGQVTAANSAAWALGVAFLANMVDRHGQRRVMLPATITSSACLLALVLLASFHAPAWTLFAPAAISGFTGGSAGAMVRARWNHLLDDAAELHTAFSLESTLDELTFILGPVLATILATMVAPAAGLAAVVVLCTSGALVFYSLRDSEPPVARQPASGSGTAGGLLLAEPGVLPLALVAAAVGAIFGSIDVSVVAATEDWGNKANSGIVMACLAAGSGLAGFVYGSRRWGGALHRVFVAGVLALAGGTLLFLLADSPWTLAVIGFAVAATIAPTLINANELMQRIVDPSRLTEGIAWIGTATGIGSSIGAAVAGQLIDIAGHRGGFLTGVGAGAAAAAIGVASVSAIAKASRKEPEPAR
jgi:MFS family permease